MGMFFVAPTASFHHHHHHQSSNYVTADGNNAATASLGVGVIPHAMTGDEQDLIARNRGWQQQPIIGTSTCQDCGNQSKKDCSQQRCRTCCRSRGFDCSTHLKSTWIPAAKRRERQMMASAGASSGSTSGTKKPRIISSQTSSHTSTSNTPPTSFDTSSTHKDGSKKEALPGQLREHAVFKCVKVTAVEDGEDEYAYQAVVKIGGHLFKGFLYDQGVESRNGFPNLSELHLGGGVDGDGGRNGPLLDTSHVYGTSGGGGSGGGLFGP